MNTAGSVPPMTGVQFCTGNPQVTRFGKAQLRGPVHAERVACLSVLCAELGCRLAGVSGRV